MAGVYLIRSRITGATQFDGVAPIVTFNEFLGGTGTQFPALPPSMTARILGYSYASLGAAHTIRLSLRSPLNVVPNLDDEIILRSQSDVNTFAEVCGPDGLVVPRNFGISASNQQPPVSTITSQATFQVFFTTTGKADAGTFMLWYRIADENQ